jgi:hypothetical protein
MSITPIMEQAYLADEIVRAKRALEKDSTLRRILERQDMVEWSRSPDYERPTMFIPRPKKSVMSLKQFFHSLKP